VRRETFLAKNFIVANQSEAAALIGRTIEARSVGRIILHGNAHMLRLSARQPTLASVLGAKATMLFFEGVGLKFACLLTRGEWWPDANGTDLVPLVLAQPRKTRLRLALVGGKPGVAGGAAPSLIRGLDMVDVVATFDGYSDCSDRDRLISDLESAHPDLVLVGLGTPLQECSAFSWAERMPNTAFWAVGGLFDYHTGRPRAPSWIRQMRFEWAWRILMEPSRLWRRYAGEAVWLIGVVISQILRSHNREPRKAKALS
jgi:exopolysaccharide biosynthesis WecB/TagA/CpsF family protein